MIFEMYKKAFSVLLKKPFRLWGVSLLEGLLAGVAGVLFGIIPGIALAIELLLTTSMTNIYLHGLDGDEVEAVQLFDCFKSWEIIKRVLGGMGWMLLWIFIWSLIPVAGPIIAIVKAYEYRFTPYILIREPEVPITQAIKESQKRTDGCKGKMFWADVLAFVLPYVALLILALFARIPYIGILFALVTVLFFICYIIFIPFFIGLVRASFYKTVKEKSRVNEENFNY